jgi:hypothetical protein
MVFYLRLFTFQKDRIQLIYSTKAIEGKKSRGKINSKTTKSKEHIWETCPPKMVYP